MHTRKQFYLYLLGGAFILTVAALVFSAFSPEEKSFLFQKSVFSNSQYLFPQEKQALEATDSNIVGGAFLESGGPPFLVSGQTYASISEGSNRGAGEIREYEVKEGESIGSIAEKFGVSLNTIFWANDLNSKSVINPGDKLVILPVSGTLHIVGKGDTLSRIAGTYEADIEDIVEVNGLESEDDIYVGDLLIVPGGKEPKTPVQLAHIPIAESYFIYPVEGRITQGLHGVTGEAVDIANQCGAPVVAAAPGTVQRAGSIWIGGNRITILHDNGVVTYYGHLSSILVSPGQRVSTGDIIGKVGNTGYTLGVTGCHLHFETRGSRNFLGSYSVGSIIKWGN